MKRTRESAELIKVRTDILNPAICGEDTVLLVSRLLDAAAEEDLAPNRELSSTVERVAPKARSTRNQNGRAIRQQSKTRSGQRTKPLPASVRFQFATEVANSTLKTLTQVIRDLPKSDRQNPENGGPSTKENRSSEGFPENQGLRNIGRCARIAFSTLRERTTSNVLSVSDQVESGTISLVGKFITLSLHDFAAAELRTLLQRLAVFRLGIPVNLDISSPAATCVDLLRIDKIPASEESLPILITSLLYAIRLIAIRGGVNISKVVEAVCDDKQLSVYDLVCQAHQSGILSSDEAAKHLTTLARAISEIAIRTRTKSEDIPLFDANTDEYLVLRCKLFAQKAQQGAWLLTKKPVNFINEVARPLLKSLRHSTRRISTLTQARFDIISAKVGEQLVWGSEAPSLALETAAREPTEIDDIRSLLANLKTLCLLDHDRSETFLEQEPSGSHHRSVNSITDLSIHLRSVTTMLQSSSQTSDSGSQSLLQLVKDISRVGMSESSELDEILLSLSTVRRVCFQQLRHASLGAQKRSTGFWDKYKGHVSILLVVPSFMLSYLQDSLAEIQSQDKRKVTKHRIAMINQVARPTVDALLAVPKILIQLDQSDTSHFHRAVADFAQLLEILDKCATQKLGELDQRLQGTCIELSDCLASLFLKTQSPTRSRIGAVALLVLSAKLLENRPIEEQKAGNLVGKAEKAAKELLSTSDKEAAMHWLRIAIHQAMQELQQPQRPPEIIAPHRENPPESVGVGQTTLLRLCRRYLRYTPTPNAVDDLLAMHNHKHRLDQQCLVILFESQLLEAIVLSKERPENTMPLIDRFIDILSSSKLSDCGAADQLRWVSMVLHMLTLTEGSFRIDAIQRCNRILNALRMLQVAIHVSSEFYVAICEIAVYCLSDEVIECRVRELLERCFQNLSHANADNALELPTHILHHYVEQFEIFAAYFTLHHLMHERSRCLEINLLLVGRMVHDQSRYKTQLNLKLAEQYIQVGWMSRARTIIESLGEEEISDDRSTSKVAILKQEYFTHLPSLEQASHWSFETFRKLQEMESPTTQMTRPKNYRTALAEFKFRFLELLAELSHAQGDESNALLYARLGMRCAHTLSNLYSRDLEGEHTRGDIIQNPTSPRSNNTDEETASYRVQTPQGYSKRRSILRAAPSLISALSLLSRCLAKCGLITDARSCLSQAQELAYKSQSSGWTAHTQHLDMLYDILELKSLNQDGQPRRNLTFDIPPIGLVTLSTWLDLCSEYAELDSQDIPMDAASVIRAGLARMSPLDCRDPSIIDDLDLDLQRLELRETGAATVSTWQRQESREHGTRETHDMQTASLEGSEPSLFLSRSHKDDVLQRLNVRIKILRAMVASSQDKDFELLELATGLNTKDFQLADLAQYHTILARVHLRKALGMLSSNPVFNALCEAPLSFPSYSLDIPPNPTTKFNAVRTHRSRTSPAPLKPRNGDDDMAPALDLQIAKSSIFKAIELLRESCPTWKMHRLSDELSKVLMLESAATTVPQKNFKFYETIDALEMGRNIAWQRRMAVSVAEQYTTHFAGSFADYSEIPLLSEEVMNGSGKSSSFEDLYNMTPPNWMILSLSISHDQSDLRVCRVRRGNEPFMLSIPLNRQRDETDSEHFSFQDCKDELSEIVSLANQSTRSQADTPHRGARSDWWKKRSELDERLKDVLTSIDGIWLGGFRGIFTQLSPNPTAMSDFLSTFDKILAKHLPSRQRGSRSKRNPPLSIDRQILELFVGLGPPDEEGELDDCVLDLLSFVVDILQFHGESNAYDEIDFDAMILDVTDALRKHHRCSSVGISQGDLHTVLILDKHLHCFPWESLPCTRGMSISRLPSLEAMRNILVSQGAASSVATEFNRIAVESNSGAYVLNPGADLVNTQAMFQLPLSKLPLSWDGLVQTKPEETELETMLKSKAIYLYFGHGSGAQYIRGKTVRRLNKCAVSLLMGCSSVAVSEFGQFESYGVPLTYLEAGAPAVLGTLWDVTDKDIDRFSKEVLERWGLFKSTSMRQDDGVGTRPGNKSSKKYQVLEERGHRTPLQAEVKGVSLDQAVASARQSCLMQYLNGAAPVVYGVPVFLK